MAFGEETDWSGPFGQAQALEIPDHPLASETVCWWLLTCPGQALWSQYSLMCIRLRDVDGMPAPVRNFVGATHEVMLVALASDEDWTPQTLLERSFSTGVPWLQPVNVVEQFEATDDEMRRMVCMSAWGCVQGALQMEAPANLIVADGHGVLDLAANRPQMREAWLESMVKTLAHIRGEEHAS